jgi:hypothetical protein
MLNDDVNNRIAENDNFDGKNAGIVINLPKDGIYTILVNGYDANSRGNYQINLNEATEAELQKVEAGASQFCIEYKYLSSNKRKIS